MNLKQESEKKNTNNEYINFLKSNFLVVNKVLLLVHSNAANNAKKCSAKK